MLPMLIGAIALLVVVMLIVVAMQPATFEVSRNAAMAASPETVFDQINNLRRWESWSPWAKLDPNMKQTYDGPEAGTGAQYAWAGDKNVGEGRMTITESQPPNRIRIRLEFLKPFAAVNTTEFRLNHENGKTIVTWTMSGTNNFIAKAMGLLMNMDKMIGGNFEQGLAAMKSIVESPQQPA